MRQFDTVSFGVQTVQGTKQFYKNFWYYLTNPLLVEMRFYHMPNTALMRGRILVPFAICFLLKLSLYNLQILQRRCTRQLLPGPQLL